jgi:hypothetical protein
MMGFIIGALALFGVMGSGSALRQYAKRNYLDVLLAICIFTMLELTASLVMSVLIYFGFTGELFVKILICLAGSSLMMLMLCVMPIFGLIKKSIS